MIASGSMILHEVYFDSLGGAGGDPGSALKAAIERDFGSLDAWRTEFTAMGKAHAVPAWSTPGPPTTPTTLPALRR